VAAIPLGVTARDDYGLTAAHLEWSVQSAPQKTRDELLRAYLPPEAEPPALGHVFDLRELASRQEAGAPPLQVGETLRLQALAVDSRPPEAGGAQRTRSNLITFRIVTPDELLAKAVDVQRTIREQLGQVIEMQTDVRDRCQGAIAQARQPTTLGLAFREVAAASETQQQIEDLLTGAVERLEALLENLRRNRAVAGEDEVRLRASVIEPLRTVTRDAVGPVLGRMEAARSLTAAAPLAAELQALVALQNRIIGVLQAVVSEMIKVENAQHVEGSLRRLIKLGDQVRKVMKKPDGPPEPAPGEPPTPRDQPKEPKP
jgi:hypothetical protein